MAAAPPLLLLIAAALLSCAAPSLCLPACPPCGSTPVPYPLSTAATCGDPAYKIRCSGGALLFDSSNNTYSITSVTPSTQRLTIAPPSFVPNTCVAGDLPSHGLQLSPSAPFNITSSNTIFYLNCNESIVNSPLNCTSTSLCHVYSNATASPCRTTPCCAFRAGGSTTAFRIRVRDEGCRAYRSFVNLDPDLPVDQWPAPAVELLWFPPPEPLCTAQADCGSGSTCGADPRPSNGSAVSRCFCNSGLVWNPVTGLCAQECKDPDGCGKDRTALITGITVGLSVALLASLVGFFFHRRHQLIKREQERLTQEREEILNAGGGKSAKVFTGKELKKATNNFAKDRLLGAGGYGEVYKGVLDDGTLVAVKCAKLGNTKSTDQVLNEVRILCQVNHKSLVGLLGCCVELQQPLLVYEYIPNGTLLEYLQGPRRDVLTWQRRLNVAYATAEGLAYLHFSAVPPIYHRDVKSSNILLDEKLNAKVADFGLSRLAHTDLSHISTCAQGTLGYLDPEYYRNYQLTDKSDVYSFGVVLLELLTSQKAIDFTRPADDVNLAVYVQRLVEEERVMEAVDPALKEGASSLELETMKAVGFLAVGCLEERRQNRPSMKEVAEEIEYIISIATAKPAAEE